MSRRPDLPCAGAPSEAGGAVRRWRAQGLSSAGLALVLLLAMIATQRSVQEPAAPVAPAAPQQQQSVAAGPPSTAAPLRDARAAVAPRAAAPAGRTAARVRTRPVRRQAPAASPRTATAAPLVVHGPMERTYLPDGQAKGVCPAGTQSAQLGLTCRGAQVRRAPRAAGGYLLRFEVCPTTTGRLDLRFADEAEVAMSVLDRSGRAVWTWRPEDAFSDDPHVLMTEVGACWVWETAWPQLDDDGDALRDGRYFLEVDFLEVDDSETYRQRFDAR